MEEGSLGAIAVTNRSDTGCLWHQGRAGRGFSFTVQLPLHSLFGRYCSSLPGSGAPRRKLERSQASSRRGWGSAEMPLQISLPQPQVFAAPLCTAPGSRFQRENRFLRLEGSCLRLAHPLTTEEWLGPLPCPCFYVLWMSIPKFGRAPLNLDAQPQTEHLALA